MNGDKDSLKVNTKNNPALAGLAQFVGMSPCTPHSGTSPGCRFDSLFGCMQEAASPCLSLTSHQCLSVCPSAFLCFCLSPSPSHPLPKLNFLKRKKNLKQRMRTDIAPEIQMAFKYVQTCSTPLRRETYSYTLTPPFMY